MDVLNALVLFTNFVLLPATAYGAQLALGALGVTLIFGILRFANFSHGELMSFGAMITILVTWWLQAQGVGIHPLPTALIALPVGVLAAVALALSVDRVVFRFYRRNRSSPIIFAMTSVGVMFVIAGLIRLTIGPEQQAFADGERFLFTVREFRAATGLAEGIGLRQTQVITIVVAVLVMLALFLFLQRARFGKAMRAYADNEDLALLSGINPERVVAVAWIIAASLAAIGATLYSLDKVYQPFIFLQILLPIFAATILGGIGQPVGAILGAFVVAYSEVMVTYAFRRVLMYLGPDGWAPEGLVQLLSTNYKFAVSFIILVLVLLIRPTGIIRGKVIER
jgi:branched-chain amino acid transport system permease protein